MNFSFYSASVGAQAQQKRMEVIANNISNANTNGFKTKQATFTDLIYTNMNAPAGEDTRLKYGAGTKMLKADTDFVQGAFEYTGFNLDYAINGPGFFCLMNPVDRSVCYTRDGSFTTSQQRNGQFYLTSSDGKWVLDAAGAPVVVENVLDDINIGVYTFAQKNGLVNVGNNQYQAADKNGQPDAIDGYRSGVLTKGALEGSNMDFAKEVSHIIESQRAYQLSLKMVQTTDEIENTINGLR